MAELAEPIRRVHDAEWFERVPPHITLLNAFEPHEGAEAVKGILDEVSRRSEPILARTRGFGAFLTQPLVLFIRLADQEPLVRLQGSLGEALPRYDYTFPYRPHITVGRFASEEGLAKVLGELGRGADGIELEVRSFSLYAEDEDGVFRCVQDFPLGRDGS